MSAEHLWGEWISRIIEPILIGRYRNYEIRDGEHIGSRPSKTLDKKALRVCEICNNRWMSDLEKEASPILSRMILPPHPDVLLSPSDQKLISKWVYKTALIADFVIRRERNPPIPPSAYTDFYQARLPPDNVLIWAAGFMGPEAFEAIRCSLLVENVIGDTATTMHDLYTSTLRLEHAVFQVVGVLSGKWTPRVDVNDSLSYLLRIWPPQDVTLSWPRNRHALDLKTFRDFVKRTNFI